MPVKLFLLSMAIPIFRRRRNCVNTKHGAIDAIDLNITLFHAINNGIQGSAWPHDP